MRAMGGGGPGWSQGAVEDQDRVDLAEAGRLAYRASQTRNQQTVSDISGQLSDSCLHCHRVYRDKRGGSAAHCTP